MNSSAKHSAMTYRPRPRGDKSGEPSGERVVRSGETVLSGTSGDGRSRARRGEAIWTMDETRGDEGSEWRGDDGALLRRGETVREEAADVWRGEVVREEAGEAGVLLSGVLFALAAFSNAAVRLRTCF